MSLLRSIPLRGWLGIFFLGAGLAVVIGAGARIEQMRAMLAGVDGDAPREERAVVEVAAGSPLERARGLAAGALGGLAREEDRLAVSHLLTSAEEAAAHGNARSVEIALSTLEAHAAMLDEDCAMHPQIDGSGRIKAMPLGDGGYRLSVECIAADGRVVYPTLIEMLPIVDAMTLESLGTAGKSTLAIGRKRSGELGVDWVNWIRAERP